jgi:hypothetical protein
MAVFGCLTANPADSRGSLEKLPVDLPQPSILLYVSVTGVTKAIALAPREYREFWEETKW